MCSSDLNHAAGSWPTEALSRSARRLVLLSAGEYVVEIGDKRFRLAAGDSVLGPRRVPHAFVYDGTGPGRLLVAFTPAENIE